MTDNPDITSFSVTSSSSINGAKSDYTFFVKTKVQMESGDKILFTFPPQITFASTLTYSGIVGVSAISCTKDSYTFKCTLTFSSSPYSSDTEF